jgi:hypothetical protein
MLTGWPDVDIGPLGVGPFQEGHGPLYLIPVKGPVLHLARRLVPDSNLKIDAKGG